MVLADRALLGQAISVLLSNALNYTPEGGSIVVSVRGKYELNGDWLGVVVHDTGMGILPEEEERLFERFFRGHAARETVTPGTGLGLSIAQEIAQRHNGWIEVERNGQPGEGTTFRLWLPAYAV